MAFQNTMHILDQHETKSGDSVICVWRVIGSIKEHDKITKEILGDKDIKEMTY